MGAREMERPESKTETEIIRRSCSSVVCAHYKEHGQMPAGAELEKLAKAAFTKIRPWAGAVL